MVVAGRYVIREEENKDVGCQRKNMWQPLPHLFLALLPLQRDQISRDGVGWCDG